MGAWGTEFCASAEPASRLPSLRCVYRCGSEAPGYSQHDAEESDGVGSESFLRYRLTSMTVAGASEDPEPGMEIAKTP